MNTVNYTLINPTTTAKVPDFNGAQRIPTLAGTTLGIIDDSKRNADVLLEELAEVLINRYEISNVIWHKKQVLRDRLTQKKSITWQRNATQL